MYYIPTTRQIQQGGTDLFRNQGFDPRGNNEGNAMLQRLQAGNFAPSASRTAFNAGVVEPNYQNTIQNLLARYRNRNYGQLGARANQGMRTAVYQGNQDANLMNRSQGLGEGFLAGTNAGIGLQGARLGNSAEAQFTDPGRQDSDLMNLISLLAGISGQDPYGDRIANYNGQTEANSQNRQAQANQGGIGGIIGSILGQGAGAWATAAGQRAGARR